MMEPIAPSLAPAPAEGAIARAETPLPRASTRRRPRRGFSMESLLASVLLHLSALFLVIVFAPERPREHVGGIVIDISKLTLPESRSGPQASASPTTRAVPAAAAVAVSAEQAREEVSAEALPEALAEAAGEPTEAQPEPEASAAQDSPQVPEFSVPHEHGEYDPFEVYKAEVAERVRQVTASSRDLPARTLFAGKLAVHLYLDASGGQLSSPKICLGHSEVYLAANMPAALAQQHFYVLMREIVDAVRIGGRFPSAPPGVTVPEEMTYFVDLSAN